MSVLCSICISDPIIYFLFFNIYTYKILQTADLFYNVLYEKKNNIEIIKSLYISVRQYYIQRRTCNSNEGFITSYIVLVGDFNLKKIIMSKA